MLESGVRRLARRHKLRASVREATALKADLFARAQHAVARVLVDVGQQCIDCIAVTLDVLKVQAALCAQVAGNTVTGVACSGNVGDVPGGLYVR